MRFQDQIFWTACVGGGSFFSGIILWLGSQAAGVEADSWATTVAWVLVMAGLYLLIGTTARALHKRDHKRRKGKGWLSYRATLTPFNRWYYWVDRNGKDRDA
jgi:hypothetical protein